MCTLYSDSYPDESIPMCYKVVLKRKADGKYISAAMGFEYVSGDLVPVVVQQKKIAYFNSDILKNCFERKMAGRTAAFENLVGANDLRDKIADSLAGLVVMGFERPGVYQVVVLVVRLRGDVVRGYYGPDSVYAGRRMDIVKEVGNSARPANVERVK